MSFNCVLSGLLNFNVESCRMFVIVFSTSNSRIDFMHFSSSMMVKIRATVYHLPFSRL